MCAPGARVACGKETRAVGSAPLSPRSPPSHSPSTGVNIVEDSGLASRLVRRGCARLHHAGQELDQAQGRGLEAGRKGVKCGRVGEV